VLVDRGWQTTSIRAPRSSTPNDDELDAAAADHAPEPIRKPAQRDQLHQIGRLA
jgi:hypothetical protein